MKSITTLLSAAAIPLALFIFSGCKTASVQKGTATELFNGKNFDSWTFCMRSNSPPEKTWSVSHGMIHCTGQPYGYARTTESYHDYKLTCIWRFVKVAAHADNSGIFVHIQPPDAVWPVCVECQGQYQHQGDFRMHAGVSADGHPAQDKTMALPQMGSPNENPAGNWNTNQITCRGSEIDLFVNGKEMNHVTGCNLTSGFIGIQSEGGDIEVRKLTLEPLE
ncbi:MAG TPA: DUF1080 domain-containing protein [Pseudomonadales bacterium]|nr:DUF1080 domain-containing protein [Pseudomonadales bacterium]